VLPTYTTTEIVYTLNQKLLQKCSECVSDWF